MNITGDGDEMNVVGIGEVGALAEARCLSTVDNFFVSTQSGNPQNGEIQDSVVGLLLLTRAGAALDKERALAVLGPLAREAGADLSGGADFTAQAPPGRGEGARAGPGPVLGGRAMTGREVVSLLLPPTLNYRSKSEWYKDGERAAYFRYDPAEAGPVEVRAGHLEAGVLDKNSVGAGRAGGLFHVIGRAGGPRAALRAAFTLQQAAGRFLAGRGLTACPTDLALPPADRARARAAVAATERDADRVTADMLAGRLVPPIEMTPRAFYERQQIACLRQVDDALALPPLLHGMQYGFGERDRSGVNGYLAMVMSGSNGTVPSLKQSAVGVGQMLVNDERLGQQFAFQRPSPFFPRFTTEPAAFGFVAGCYADGIASHELFSGAQAARFDYISQALSTSVTGDFNRRSAMALQSIVVDCRRAAACGPAIVQPIYGETGLDPRAGAAVPYWPLLAPDAEVARRCAPPGAAGTPADTAELALACAEAAAAIRADRACLRAARARLADADPRHEAGDRYRVPVDVADLARAALRPGPPPGAAELAASVRDVLAAAGSLAYAHTCAGAEARSGRSPDLPPHYPAAARLLAAHLRAAIPPDEAARWRRPALAALLALVRARYEQALVSYGTAAGLLASQSLGEPFTQYMLDSHHRSIKGGTSRAAINRVAEIYGARRPEAEQAPRMRLRIRPPGSARTGGREGRGATREQAGEVARQVALFTVRAFVARHDLLYESFGDAGGGRGHPAFAADAAMLAAAEAARPGRRPPDLTSWCLRLELARQPMVLNGVALRDVAVALRAAGPLVHFVHSDEAAEPPVVRCWPRAGAFPRAAGEAAAVALRDRLLDAPVRGVPRVSDAAAAGGAVALVERPDGSAAFEPEAYVQTAGSNLAEAALLRGVDPLRSLTSSVGETLDLLGIEAARAAIMVQTREVLETAPQPCHLMAYADAMTRTGVVTSIDRAGIAQRERANVLLRMAAGDPVRTVCDAAIEGSRAPVYGFSAPLMLGATPRLGSTFSELAVDAEFAREHRPRSLEDALLAS
jgi:hypothetical protein